MAHTVVTARPTQILERIRGAVRNLGDEMVRRKVYRTTLTELSALTNRELADLGMNRAELGRIAYEAAYGK